MVFLMPNLYLKVGLPITAPFAAVLLFWALVVKLIRDADDDPAAFRLVSMLLVVASVLYIVPQVYGMESADQAYLGGLPSALVSTTNLAIARPILWISIGLFALTGGALFVRFLVNLGRSEASTDEQAEETQIAA
jgi:hypothetical protein